MSPKTKSEKVVREIKRRTRKKYSSEEKIRIVLEGLRGEVSIAELCRREGIHTNVYYTWSKAFLEAGKRRLNGDTQREAVNKIIQWELKQRQPVFKWKQPTNPSLNFRKLLKKLNLWETSNGTRSFHTLRHTYASHLLTAGLIYSPSAAGWAIARLMSRKSIMGILFRTRLK